MSQSKEETLAIPDLPSDGGSTSLEVRWIRAGLIPDALIERLGPFDEEIERREDRYLVDPYVHHLVVKIRGRAELDLKAYRGSPGGFRVEGLGEGRLEMWVKWNFALAPGPLPPEGPSGWITVGKVRRRRSFALVRDGVQERPLSEAQLPGCTLELTEVTVGEEPWWTLALEAVGPPRSLSGGLHMTAAAVLSEPLPAPLQLDPNDSTSYVRFLRSRRERRQLERVPAMANGGDQT